MKNGFIARLLWILLTVTIVLNAVEYGKCAEGNANDITGSIQVKDVKISAKDNKSIKGIITLSNDTQDYMTELWASTEVYMVVDEASNLVGKKYFPVVIDGNAKADIAFEHPLPTNLHSGNYFMVTNVLNRTGVPISTPKKTELGKLGESNFLVYNPEELFLIKNDGSKISPLEGPLYKANQEPVFEVSFINTASTPIRAYAKIDIYERSRMYSKFTPVLTTKSREFPFDGDKKITKVSINLPKMEKPESYFAEITMMDTSGKPVSYQIEGRYVIEGLSAKIINSNARIENGKILLNTLMVGSADGSEVKGAKIEVLAMDKDSNTIGHSEKVVDLGLNLTQYNFDIPVNMSIGTIKISTVLKQGSMVLDKNEVFYDVPRMINNSKNPGTAKDTFPIDYSMDSVVSVTSTTDNKTASSMNVYIIVGLVVMALIIGGGVYWKKSR